MAGGFRHGHSPVKTGSDLFEVACGLLDDIELSFRAWDVSDRAVVENAKDEDAVQVWLDKASLDARGKRFHVIREKEVWNDNKPDIVLSSTSSPWEVAIEIKHGGNDWTLPDLRHALTVRLAETYLLPPNRRHGVLVVTNHRDRFWRDKAKSKTIRFAELIADLQALASTIHVNSTGPIVVRVRGFDASPPAKPRRRKPGA